MRAQITGRDFPQAFLSAVLRRISADRNINYIRVCGIKAVLTRNYKLITPENDLKMLNTKCKDIAYVLGRVFAVLDTTDWISKNIKDGKVQKKAESKRKTPTIRDNYYTSASTTPSVVFGRLENLHVHHIKKIRDGIPSLAASLDRQIADIKNLIDVQTEPVPGTENGYPTRLSLQQQGMFAIGYYHQRYASKEAREASDSEPTDNGSGN
jgi:CRISPR-associated protein Csd1